MKMSRVDPTIAAGFSVPKPRQADFGLSATYHKAAYEAERQAAQRKITVKTLATVMIPVAVLTGVLFKMIFGNMEVKPLAATFWIAVIGSILLKLAYHYCRVSYDDPHWESMDMRIATYEQAVAKWEIEKQEWLECQIEIGINYWRALRGVEFERAVMRFFQKRGCDVMMTKGSGDGGIDLIIKMGGKLLWGQCKGHAKPISVATIREIAGVCSKGDAQPIVFAVNGYTKSAVESAKQLGVLLCDAHHLSNWAKKVSIEAIA